MSDSPPISPLNYAVRPKLRQRRWVRWSIVGLALAIAIGFTWRTYRQAVVARGKLLYWQHECLTFSAPNDLIVLADQKTLGGLTAAQRSPRGFDDADKLPVTSIVGSWMGGSHPRRIVIVAKPGTALIAPPKPVTALKAPSPANPTRLMLMPHCWVTYAPLVGLPVKPLAVLFCHARTSRGGHERLVVVQSDLFMNADTFPRRLTWTVITPAGVFSPIAFNTGGGDASSYTLLPPAFFRAGQPDPADDSHFTIAYQWQDGVPGVIDGWLGDDDTVALQARPGPGDAHAAIKRWQESP